MPGASRLRSSMGPNFVGLKTLPRAIFVARGLRQRFSISAPFHVLFGVYFWSVIQDRSDRRVRTVGILDRHAYDQNRPSEVIWACSIAAAQVAKAKKLDRRLSTWLPRSWTGLSI